MSLAVASLKWWAVAIALAVGVAFAPLPPSVVERYYSSWLFPHLQRRITAVSNLTPYALIDVLIIAGVAWFVWQIARGVGSARTIGWGHSTLFWLVRVFAAASVVYLVFLLMWGMNYRRLPLTEKVPFDPAAVSSEAAGALAIRAADEVNALYPVVQAAAPGSASIDESLAAAFASAQAAVGVALPARPARPKWSILDVYFKAAGVEGMTDPILLETLIASDLLPFERPFAIAHEWSHLAGFANEGEANFLGWLTCTKGSVTVQYSGWLFLYSQVFGALRSTDQASVAARLDPGPRADLRAIAERVQRNIKPAVADAGWRVYDRYLKANRVEAGTASYAEVIRLVLGIRIDPA
jgi:hypothetical protein